MRRVIIIFITVFISSAIFCSNPYKWEDFPDEVDSIDVALYPCYIVVPELSALQTVNFRTPNHYYTKEFYYEPYHRTTASTDPNKLYGNYVINGDSISFFEAGMKYLLDDFWVFESYINHFGDRLYGLHLLNYIPAGKNNGRGDNISLGIIRDFAESISIPSFDESGFKHNVVLCYIPEKMYFSEHLHHPKEMFPDVYWQNYTYPYLMYNDYSKLEGKFEWFPWAPQAFRWRKGKFKVCDVKRVGTVTTRIDVEKDSLLFRVVNPRCYLRNSGLKLYSKRNEKKLTAWMSTVREGDSISLELMRPEYPRDSVVHIAPLNTGPDTIYAAYGEAYGYFFAKRIKD